jgi:UDP-GlcNAc3NAcA epimerase
MKLLSIVGTRPQFVKVAVINNLVNEFKNQHIIVHTGQHYDYDMSDIFFKDLNIRVDYNLGIGGISNCKQVGYMMAELENILFRERPSIALVYGDTNSTLAGALAACKCQVPVAHIESGMRSYTNMPEESNRVVTDHISSILFCSTSQAVDNLKLEGITERVYKVGDVMNDLVLDYAKKPCIVLSKLMLKPKSYYLATIHRTENTNQQYIKNIMQALGRLKKKVIMPLHPRTAKYVNGTFNNVTIIPPVSYTEMVSLEQNAQLIITDSGGVQKEAAILNIPCVVLRDVSEWTELVKDKRCLLSGIVPDKIVSSCQEILDMKYEDNPKYFGDGNAGRKIMEILNGSHN